MIEPGDEIGLDREQFGKVGIEVVNLRRLRHHFDDPLPDLLSAAERAEAPRLHRVLAAVAGGRMGAEAALAELAGNGWKPDYVEVRRRDMAPAGEKDRERVALGAARLGATRLIDSLEFSA